MPVVRVMDMQVLVLQLRVRVHVAVPLPQQQDDARGHQRARQQVQRPRPLAEQGHRHQGAHEGSRGEVRRFACRAQKPQGIGVQDDGEPIAGEAEHQGRPQHRGRALKPGMFAKVTLYTGQTLRAVAIPESAVVDDNGRPTVFVMEGGESFFKRAIGPGVRSGGWVQVLDGVKEGERVVSRGAYELKLSTATGAIPEHGHQH